MCVEWCGRKKNDVEEKKRWCGVLKDEMEGVESRNYCT